MKYTFNRIGQIQAVGFWIWKKNEKMQVTNPQNI